MKANHLRASILSLCVLSEMKETRIIKKILAMLEGFETTAPAFLEGYGALCAEALQSDGVKDAILREILLCSSPFSKESMKKSFEAMDEALKKAAAYDAAVLFSLGETNPREILAAAAEKYGDYREEIL